MSWLDKVLDKLVLLDSNSLADTIITILKYILEFFAYFWSLITTNIIDFSFKLFDYTFSIQFNLLWLFTIGAFVTFVVAKVIAVIPVLPD